MVHSCLMLMLCLSAQLLLFQCALMAAPQENPLASGSWPNLKTPTMGGMQLWTDHMWRNGWRIQQHALTGHWRLLDDQNVRHAWGSREACVSVLQQEQPRPVVSDGHMVIFLHGLMRSSGSMSKLGSFVAEQTQQPVAYFEYASTRSSISDHASAFREVVANLPPGIRLSFVGHSMGNIVVRHAFGDWIEAGDKATLDRIQSVVMLGPPNQGSSIARQLSKTGLFGWVTGKGGMELGPHWREFEAKLATPTCPFGIIAGRLPDSQQNPLVDGHGDFVVSVEETKMPGAVDFLEVPRLHSFNPGLRGIRGAHVPPPWAILGSSRWDCFSAKGTALK
jgi:pimeloyl-ACP methyl ester carboxylesterase